MKWIFNIRRSSFTFLCAYAAYALKENGSLSLPLIGDDSSYMIWTYYNIAYSEGVYINRLGNVIKNDFIKLVPCPGMVITMLYLNIMSKLMMDV